MTEATALADQVVTDRGLAGRAAMHRALGDETRLRVVDALQWSDRSPKELARLAGASTNLLAFHLKVLEDAGLVARSASQGDGRRRYVTLDRARFGQLAEPRPLAVSAEHVLFVCTANSARSQLAAALWHARTGAPAVSAGTHPADQVHPWAVEVARSHGLDLSRARPRGYTDLELTPELVVSVCDRARESSAAFEAPLVHWSVKDPVGSGRDAFVAALDDLTGRVDWLARSIRGASPVSAAPPSPPEDTS